MQGILSKNIEPVYLESRPGDVKKTHADIEKAKRLLGWQPKVNFSQGLVKTAQWFEDKYNREK